jgi:hypothetical protein
MQLGVANHIGPEPCGGVREGGFEEFYALSLNEIGKIKIPEGAGPLASECTVASAISVRAYFPERQFEAASERRRSAP